MQKSYHLPNITWKRWIIFIIKNHYRGWRDDSVPTWCLTATCNSSFKTSDALLDLIHTM